RGASSGRTSGGPRWRRLGVRWEGCSPGRRGAAGRDAVLGELAGRAGGRTPRRRSARRSWRDRERATGRLTPFLEAWAGRGPTLWEGTGDGDGSAFGGRDA